MSRYSWLTQFIWRIYLYSFTVICRRITPYSNNTIVFIWDCTTKFCLCGTVQMWLFICRTKILRNYKRLISFEILRLDLWTGVSCIVQQFSCCVNIFFSCLRSKFETYHQSPWQCSSGIHSMLVACNTILVLELHFSHHLRIPSWRE